MTAREHADEQLRSRLVEIENLARLGFKPSQISHAFGYSSQHFTKMCKKYPEVEAAYRRGRALGIGVVANALYSNAVENENVVAQIFFLKNVAGWRDKPEDEEDRNKVPQIIISPLEPRHLSPPEQEEDDDDVEDAIYEENVDDA